MSLQGLSHQLCPMSYKYEQAFFLHYDFSECFFSKQERLLIQVVDFEPGFENKFHNFGIARSLLEHSMVFEHIHACVSTAILVQQPSVLLVRFQDEIHIGACIHQSLPFFEWSVRDRTLVQWVEF